MLTTCPTPLRAVIEAARIAALQSYNILDSPPAPEFARLAESIAHQLQVPIALVSLIDRHRQWVKASAGLPINELPRHLSFCHYTLAAQTGTFAVMDLSADVRFDCHPLVNGAPHLRFYAGAVVTDQEGYRLGTVSVMDRRSAEFSETGWDLLRQAAAWVAGLLAARRAAGNLSAEAPATLDASAQHSGAHGIPAPHSATRGSVQPMQAGQAWLGVKTELAPPLPGSGQVGRLVRKVARNSPAERAGLQAGDVLLSIDQQPMRRSTDIVNALACHAVGGRAELRAWRSGRMMRLSILVEAAPP